MTEAEAVQIILAQWRGGPPSEAEVRRRQAQSARRQAAAAERHRARVGG
jgi:hypothetical protein